MKYVEFINQVIKQKVSQQERILLFGQNIAAGSCISGFTRGIKVNEGSLIVNTPNCENTLCGIGLGAMMNGVNAVFFMKQQDFLLLGIDQLVNTYNIARRKTLKASFTIMPVIVDSGYEGPQSALNNFSDFCSIARIPGFTITTKAEAVAIIDKYFTGPGLKILAVSQRLFKTEIIELDPIDVSDDCSIFQYAQGQAATIVCFNLSFTHGRSLRQRILEKGLEASLFNVSAAMPVSWQKIIDDLKGTKRLVIIDDTKSVNAPWQGFLNAVYAQCPLEKIVTVQRSFEGYWCRPHHDQLQIDYDKVISDLDFQNADLPLK